MLLCLCITNGFIPLIPNTHTSLWWVLSTGQLWQDHTQWIFYRMIGTFPSHPCQENRIMHHETLIWVQIILLIEVMVKFWNLIIVKIVCCNCICYWFSFCIVHWPSVKRPPSPQLEIKLRWFIFFPAWKFRTNKVFTSYEEANHLCH